MGHDSMQRRQQQSIERDEHLRPTKKRGGSATRKAISFVILTFEARRPSLWIDIKFNAHVQIKKIQFF